jgi:hypothetical protein
MSLSLSNISLCNILDNFEWGAQKGTSYNPWKLI